MTILGLILLPILTAFIGWLTNWFAIRMLFHPRKLVTILGFDIHGLIPRRQYEIASRIGETVEEEILTGHVIRGMLKEIDLTPHLEQYSRELIRNRLAPKIQQIPLVGSIVSGSSVGMLEKMVREEIQRSNGSLMSRVAAVGEKQLPIKELVTERIISFDLDKLEEVVRRVASREFRAIEIMGAVLGFVVGVVQIGLLLAFGALG